ncbi:plant/F17J16-140 protein [Trifolium pratense]|uniref:Plant/F17J16-140 protein n=2 Tax=Trifolium TaxID=3898 RepID=A0A2K3NPL6_TRIPR|nr:plant/F17J16-140 protein [Trifolium pratense]
MAGFGGGHCFPYPLFAVITILAVVHSIIASIASLQLLRIHLRSLQQGWTRQKVFHLLIGSSNWGYSIYLALILLAACKELTYWSHSCGFIFMALPKVLFFAAFLLLLSFWVDLCHQPDDDDDYEGSFSEEPLLGKTSNELILLNRDRHRKCFPIRFSRIGYRQKIVTMVLLLLLITIMAFAVIIWIGLGKNPIDSEVVARSFNNLFKHVLVTKDLMQVYLDISAIGMLFLGGALACYGKLATAVLVVFHSKLRILLCLKMSKVRAEKPSSEMGKVAGLTIVSVLCITSSSCVELLTDIPMMFHWHQQRTMNDVCASLLLILYFFVGSSIPSAVVLWVMRELPPAEADDVVEESSTIAFVPDNSVVVHHPQRWTTATSVQNQ